MTTVFLNTFDKLLHFIINNWSKQTFLQIFCFVFEIYLFVYVYCFFFVFFIIISISFLVLLFFPCFFFILIFLEGCFMFVFFIYFFWVYFILYFLLYFLFNQCFYASKNVIDNYILFQSWLFISYINIRSHYVMIIMVIYKLIVI